MVPEGWAGTSLGEIALISGGTTPSKKLDAYWDGPFSWATPTDVTGLPDGQLFIDKTSARITSEGLKAAGLSPLEPGSVLMTSRATIGEAVINRVPMTTNQGFCNFTPSRLLDSEFLAYWLRQNKSKLVSLAGGSTFLEVSKASVRKLQIALPPLPEQKKIAEILGSVDEAIQATQAVIDQTRKVKQGLLQQLLTRGIGHTRFKQTEIGEIPEDWQLTCAEKLCRQISKGTTPRRQDLVSKDPPNIPFIRVQNLTFEGRLAFASAPMSVPEQIHRGFLNRSRLFPGDVLTNIVGPPLGKVSVVPDDYPEWNVNQAIAFFRPGEHCETQLLCYWLQCPVAKSWLKVRSKKTSGQENLTLALCRALPIPLIPRIEQRRILECLGVSDSMIQEADEHCDSLQALKRGLMQDLLTGRVRVPLATKGLERN